MRTVEFKIITIVKTPDAMEWYRALKRYCNEQCCHPYRFYTEDRKSIMILVDLDFEFKSLYDAVFNYTGNGGSAELVNDVLF